MVNGGGHQMVNVRSVDQTWVSLRQIGDSHLRFWSASVSCVRETCLTSLMATRSSSPKTAQESVIAEFAIEGGLTINEMLDTFLSIVDRIQKRPANCDCRCSQTYRFQYV